MYSEPGRKNIIILGGCRYWQYFKSTKLNLPFLGVSNSDNEAFEEKGEVMASIVTLLAWINRPCLGWHWKYLKRDRVTITAHKHVEVTQRKPNKYSTRFKQWLPLRPHLWSAMTPSFLPSGSSSWIPAQTPLANFVSPMNLSVPCFSLFTSTWERARVAYDLSRKVVENRPLHYHQKVVSFKCDSKLRSGVSRLILPACQ